MFEPIKLYAYGSYCQKTEEYSTSLKPEIKAEFGHSIRRIDRFTQLALLGANRCIREIKLEKNTGLYLSSERGSINNSIQAMTEIFRDHATPKPLLFVNTVSNAACFHLAKKFDFQASNQFIARTHFALEGGMKFAALDMHINNINAALIGIVEEFGPPLKAHQERLNLSKDEKPTEFSHWLLLAKDLPNHSPVASIVQLEDSIPFSTLQKRLSECLGCNNIGDIVYGENVNNEEKDKIEAEYSFNRTNLFTENTSSEKNSGYRICSWLASASATRLIHVDTDNTNKWSLIIIDRA